MKRLNLSSVLIIGAMAVAAARYTGLFANSEGWRITGPVWDWIVALSGVGMAVLEGVATWWMWNAWAETQPSRERNVLAAFMVASGAALLVMVAPYVQASSNGLRVSQVLSTPAMWVWSTANAIAPLLVMAGVGLAEKLRTVIAGQQAQPAVDIQALRDALREEWRADIAQIERKRPLQAVQVNVHNDTNAPQIATSNPQPAPLQLSEPDADLQVAISELSGVSLVDAVAQLQERGYSKAAIATALGKPAYAISPSRISKTEVLP